MFANIWLARLYLTSHETHIHVPRRDNRFKDTDKDTNKVQEARDFMTWLMLGYLLGYNYNLYPGFEDQLAAGKHP